MPTEAMRRENYIPGFDWVRLLGSILVVVSHLGLLEPLRSLAGDTLYQLLSAVVPVFFLMAGYLIAGKLDDRAYVVRYVKKYGGFYLAVSLLLIAAHAFGTLYLYRRIDLSALLAALAQLPFKCVYNSTFWFIPALLYGVAVNALLNRKPRALRAVCAVCLIAIALRALTGKSHPLYPVFSVARSVAKGVVYVRLGVLRRERTLPLPLIAAAAVLLGAFELTVAYLDLAVIALSLLLFEGVLHLGGRFLRPRHRQISVFSVLNFFLQIFERKLLAFLFHLRPIAILPLILAGNALLALLLCRGIQIKQQRKQNNGL